MSSQQPKKRKHTEEVDDDVSGVVKDLKQKKDIEEDSDEESEDSEEDSDYSDSDGSEGKEFLNKDIQIDFTAYPPIDEDFNGVKCLLSQLWLKEQINVSDLTQLLIDQKHICSILKQEVELDDEEEPDEEEDDDVYGVTSIIPLVDYSDKECVKQIRSTLLSYLPKDNPINKLLSNSSTKIGLLVNERFTNLPPKISLPSYQSLLNDLKTSKDDKQNKLNLNFEWYLMVCKVLKSKESKKSTDAEVVYVNAEEELFDELADHSFEYSVAHQCDSDAYDWKDKERLMEPFRKVLLLSKQNWNKAINKLMDEFK